VAALFNEELGAVLQVPRERKAGIFGALKQAGLGRYVHTLGSLSEDDNITFTHQGRVVLSESRVALARGRRPRFTCNRCVIIRNARNRSMTVFSMWPTRA
jgi:hypothetical protein